MIVLRKKQVLIAGLAVFAAAAGYLNFAYGDTAPASTETLGEVKLVSTEAETEADLCSEARLEREIGRSQSVASLQNLVHDQSASAESRAAAESELLEISRLSETEGTVESLLAAKGFPDSVIYISDGSVTAIVKGEGLSSQAVAGIVDIITTQTGISADKIQIVETA